MPALPRVDDETLEEEADEEVLDVACVACGTTDAKAFSHRMIKRRGRHGDRTRRCLACVASGAGLATDQSASGVAFAAPDAECGSCGGTQDKQRRKLLKALRQIGELKERRDAGVPLENTQLAKIGREAELRSELERLEAGEATGQARAASSALTAAPRKRPAEDEAVAPHGLQTRHEIRAAKAQRKLQRRQRGGFGKHLESAGPEGHATPMVRVGTVGQTTV